MLRIVLSGDLKDLVEGLGWPIEKIKRVMKHGQIVHKGRFDIILDRDADDLPNNVVTFLRNRAEVIYVAEWDGVSGPTYDSEGTLIAPAGTVLKGADPGLHKFAGWPV